MATKTIRFTIPKPKSGSDCLGKVAIPRCSWENLPGVLEKLIAQVDSGKNAEGEKLPKQPATVKGVLSLY